MRKKVLSVLLCTAMAATLLTGCGGSTEETSNNDASSNAASSNASSEGTTSKAEVSSGGKVLNIRCWNDEIIRRVKDHYPGYKATGKKTGKIGDVTVKWNITPSDENAYQNALDEALLNQAEAKADEKIDMFLVEADYALKYVDTEYTVDVVNDLGVSEESLAEQYQYTKDIVTDSNGALKGASWQGCPGGMIYRRDVAKKVFGTDDPEKIQEKFADWDTFKSSAAELKDAGYQVTASVNDTYRVYSNHVTSKWVEDGKINIDENIKKWVDDSKEMVDNGYTATHELWGSDWSAGFMESGNVFCYFGPAWFIDFSMNAKKDGKWVKGSVGAARNWALTEGPQSFFWGGTWICGANGTDNADLVKDIIEKLTCDQEILTDIATKDSDFVNNKSVIETLADNKKFKNEILGGQNPISIFASGIDSIDMSNVTAYDQTCTEQFQNAMKDYFDGNSTYEEALEVFYKSIETKHPEVSH